MDKPPLETARLVLRSFTLDDAPAVFRLVNTPELADTMLTIPYPYPEELAAQWIASHDITWQAGNGGPWAIVERASNQLVGAISLMVNREHQRAEVGYWLGKEFWNRGYVSEAAQAVVRCGFEMMALNRIYAFHFARNPASGRVMQKIGMRYEGIQRQHLLKNQRFEDCVCYGIVREDWLADAAS